MQPTTQRGFAVRCIKCADENAVVHVSLSDTSAFKCDGCDEEFSADDVREFIGQWQAVLAWCDAAPAL